MILTKEELVEKRFSDYLESAKSFSSNTASCKSNLEMWKKFENLNEIELATAPKIIKFLEEQINRLEYEKTL